MTPVSLPVRLVRLIHGATMGMRSKLPVLHREIFNVIGEPSNVDCGMLNLDHTHL